MRRPNGGMPKRLARGYWAVYLVIVTLLVLRDCGQLGAAPRGDADWITSLIYREAAEYGVSGDWLLWVALCETGGTLDPYRVGRQGEIGLFQWHPHGLWRQVPIFSGWWDVYDVTLNVRGAAWAFSRGLSYHWSCAR